MSKQLGILFKGEMVRAILEGRKTQTRRGVKFMKRSPACASSDFKSYKLNEVGCWFSGLLTDGAPFMENVPLPWQVGDSLYVKETWWSYGYFEETGEATKSGKPKKQWKMAWEGAVFLDQKKPPMQSALTDNFKWRKMSSLFLRKDDARIWLKVTNVRVERLLDISEADAIAEGIISHKGVPGEYPSETMYKDYLGTSCVISPIHSYFTLWDSINGAGSHKENCWVWVIEFERCKKP